MEEGYIIEGKLSTLYPNPKDAKVGNVINEVIGHTAKENTIPF